MIQTSVRIGSPARPLAHASGRVAWGRRVVTFLVALSSVLLVAACDGTPIGLDGGLNGGGSGVGGGTGGGGTGGGTGGGSGSTANGVPSFVFVTAGGGHTCALTENSVAWCWGDNSMGGLGIDSAIRTSLPRPVASGSTSFKALSAGGGHTCGLDQNNVAWCWGSNTSGALGIGSTRDSSNVPLRVSTSRSFTSISAGSSHTCAVAENGTPFCWGDNTFGQLGDGTTTDALTPVQVSGLSEVLAITAGTDHSCALRVTGAVMCWGNSPMLGTTGSSTTPVFINSIASYAGVEAGSEVTCAIETAVQRAACWGFPARVGSAGASGTAPVRVAIDNDVVEVSAGDWSACARISNGLVRCWGNNQFGQLGLGDAVRDSASVTPRPVVGDLTFRMISVGGAHVCGITPRLETYCWGYNQWLQLGSQVGTTGVPTKIPSLVP
jgi:alpha-tubulin suppressor-like RCC1 family protein